MLLGDLVFVLVANLFSFVINSFIGIPIDFFKQAIGL